MMEQTSGQSDCLVGLLDTSSGQICFLRSPNCDSVPAREQKMIALLASTITFSKSSVKANVNIEQAFGSAVNFIWKTVSESLIVIVLGSIRRFPSQTGLDDFAELINDCAKLVFGNMPLSSSDGINPLRLHYGQMSVLGNFIDFLYLHITSMCEDANLFPITFHVPLVEIMQSDSVDSLSDCLNVFSESIGAAAGMIISSGRLAVLSSQILEIMIIPHVRCLALLSTCLNHLASTTCNSGRTKESWPARSEPASLRLFIPDRKDKEKCRSYKLVCTPIHSSSRSVKQFGVFLFPCPENSTGLLVENVSAEVNRYWRPIFNTKMRAFKSPHTMYELGGRSDVLSAALEHHGVAVLKNDAHGTTQPYVICVAHFQSGTCCVSFSPSEEATRLDVYSQLISLIRKTSRLFSSSASDFLTQQSLSRRPSTIFLRYQDYVCVAISRSPLTVFAVLPNQITNKEAIKVVAEIGVETAFSSNLANLLKKEQHISDAGSK